MITNFGNGNPELCNLPRKLNIGLSPSRDDFPHTHINDVGLKAVADPSTGEVRPPILHTAATITYLLCTLHSHRRPSSVKAN